MARKIDYEELGNKLSKLIVEHMNEDKIPVPAADALDICSSLARIHQIELDLQGKFQEI